jgi:UPF0755 protein
MPERRAVADSHERSAEEREAARQERANRRARREGRPEPYADGSAVVPPAADPVEAPEPDAVEQPDPVPEPQPDPVPEAQPQPDPVPEPQPDPVPDPQPDPVPASQPDPAPQPDPEPPPEPDPDPEPEPDPGPPSLASERDPEPPPTRTSNRPLVEPIDPPEAPVRPMKSFPSPPDPDFYVADEQLEVPSGTRRVAHGSRHLRGSRAGRGGGGGAPRPRRLRRWFGRLLALIALLLAAAIIYFAIEVFQPFGSSPHGRVTVHIPRDTSASTVGKILERRGVIGSSFFFEIRTALDSDRSKLHAGTYHLRKGMSFSSVLSTLTKAPKAAPTSRLTITEGHTRQYVAALLRREHVKGSYLAATRRSKLLNLRTYGAPKSVSSLEGFLFPDTFALRKPVKLSALVAAQLKDFKKRFAEVDLDYARSHHLSPYDVVTIASLIEGEAASEHDRTLVASVIYNRLRDHMMLQLDSTTRYATGNFTKPLLESQLNSSSPYNTRTHFGLPPGPINSPGLAALRAAAHPANSRFLYFFTKPCTNQAVFATSFAQFSNLLVRDKRTHCPSH